MKENSIYISLVKLMIQKLTFSLFSFARVWHQCKIDNPELSVHIECMGTVFWQYLAPVKSLIFNSPTEMVRI